MKELCPLPLLEQDSLDPTLAQGPHHLSGSSQGRNNQHDNRNTQRASEEPGVYTLSKPSDEDGGGESVGDVSTLERDMLLAFKEHEKLSSAPVSSSPCPRLQSFEPPPPQIDQETDQSRTDYDRLEELRQGSLLRSQDQEDGEKGPQEQQLQEVAVDAIIDIEDDGGKPKQGEQGGKWQRQDGIEEVSSDIHQSEGSGCSHNTIDEDEDDDEPRPAKRRKRHSQLQGSNASS